MRLLSKLTIVLVSILFLTGCVTQQKCLEKFPLKLDSVVVIHDSIRIVHDTIYQAYQELTFSDNVPCPDVVYSKSVTKGSLTGSVTINKGVVTIKCVDDSLRLVIDRLERSKTITRTIVKEPKTIIEYQTKWYDTFLRWLFVVLILVALGDLALSFYRLKK